MLNREIMENQKIHRSMNRLSDKTAEPMSFFDKLCDNYSKISNIPIIIMLITVALQIAFKNKIIHCVLCLTISASLLFLYFISGKSSYTRDKGLIVCASIWIFNLLATVLGVIFT